MLSGTKMTVLRAEKTKPHSPSQLGGNTESGEEVRKTVRPGKKTPKLGRGWSFILKMTMWQFFAFTSAGLLTDELR